MNTAAAPPTAPPDDPVPPALADPALQSDLLAHALAILDCRLADKRREEAQEVVQSACEVAVRRKADYDATAGTVAAWVHGILTRTAISHARAARNRAPQLGDGGDWDRLATDFGAPTEVTDAALDLPAYLDKLPPTERALLEMRYLESLDIEQIAKRLGISPGAARVRLCRALKAAGVAAGVTATEDRT